MQFIPGNTARRTEECRAGLMAGPLAEQADVGEFRTELPGLDPVNDLDPVSYTHLTLPTKA